MNLVRRLPSSYFLVLVLAVSCGQWEKTPTPTGASAAAVAQSNAMVSGVWLGPCQPSTTTTQTKRMQLSFLSSASSLTVTNLSYNNPSDCTLNQNSNSLGTKTYQYGVQGQIAGTNYFQIYYIDPFNTGTWTYDGVSVNGATLNLIVTPPGTTSGAVTTAAQSGAATATTFTSAGTGQTSQTATPSGTPFLPED